MIIFMYRRTDRLRWPAAAEVEVVVPPSLELNVGLGQLHGGWWLVGAWRASM